MKILPFILPVLFYTGDKEWKKSNKFEDLIDIKYQSFKKYIPSFEYLNFNVSNQNLNDLKEMDSILSQLLAINLEEDLEKYNIFLQKIRTISEQLLKKEQREILFKEISFYLQFKATNYIDVDVDDIEEILNGGNIMKLKAFEKIIEKTKQEGRDEGKIDLIKRMLKANIQIHQIMEVSGLTEAEIEKIQEEI